MYLLNNHFIFNLFLFNYCILLIDFQFVELLNVARSAGLHAQRTKRLGNQWEVQRGAVMEELRDTKAEVHSLTIERNQLHKETEQLRNIINDYIRGVGLSTIRQRENNSGKSNSSSNTTSKSKSKTKEKGNMRSNGEPKHHINPNQKTHMSADEERTLKEREEMKNDILNSLASQKKANKSSHNHTNNTLPEIYESDEEDIDEMAVRNRVNSIKQADLQMNALLLELGSEKRVQKASIRGTQRLMKQFLSSMEALNAGVRK